MREGGSSRALKPSRAPKPSRSSKPSSIQQTQASSSRPSFGWQVCPPCTKKLLPDSSQLAKWHRAAGLGAAGPAALTSRQRHPGRSVEMAVRSSSQRSPSAASGWLSALRRPPYTAMELRSDSHMAAWLNRGGGTGSSSSGWHDASSCGSCRRPRTEMSELPARGSKARPRTPPKTIITPRVSPYSPGPRHPGKRDDTVALVLRVAWVQAAGVHPRRLDCGELPEGLRPLLGRAPREPRTLLVTKLLPQQAQAHVGGDAPPPGPRGRHEGAGPGHVEVEGQ
mmetsp:Transcript_83324/g.258756  ORF Transcript_83324/g.258756 Transcript_83324/m.258756 type:complete len:281 (-) Transcript_83324:80-922(-)